ncbi:MAG: phage antirepressor KilAC domain-containing protein [Oscillospiraceae bacterium]|nr:phage antirepressor KilAC domain-containing protein [Oscillospiraceae bacterium]
MNALIKVKFDETSDTMPTISGRELHKALEVKTRYDIWFSRVCEYGFAENTDFLAIVQKRTTAQGNETAFTDHQLSIDMAKEICMFQRSEIGKKCREYFLELERRWNSPEAVMARALKMADVKLLEATQKIQVLETTVNIQKQQIAELQPKASYYDLVLNCPDLLSTTEIAKDYGKSAVWLNNYLHSKGIQFKQSGIWILYQKYAEQGYTSTKTHNYNGKDGYQHCKPHTYWTQKGRLFIYDTLKKDGILPTIERGLVS